MTLVETLSNLDIVSHPSINVYAQIESAETTIIAIIMHYNIIHMFQVFKFDNYKL